MTTPFIPPQTHPDSYQWLSQQNPHLIDYVTVIACAHNYVEFFAGMNMETQDPAKFLTGGDLQTLSTVVMDWPAKEGARPAPNLADLLLSIKVTEGYPPQTFAQALDMHVQRMCAWMVDHNYNPDNPNETAKERSNRLAAARMRKYREKVSVADVEDPAEMDLVRALRAAQDNLKAGKSWMRDQEASAKRAYDAAVAHAKLARSTTVSTAQAHVDIAAQAVVEAERVLSEYRINK